MSRIVISRLDCLRIKKWIGEALQARSLSGAEAEKLLGELESAGIVEPDQIPSDVVTMNSVVRITFLNTNQHVSFRLVYPDQANVKESRISIFSPVATALLGYRKGDIIEWVVPSGLTKIKIDEIIYQPESSGDFDL